MKAPHEIWLSLVERFWRRSLKVVDRRTDDDGRSMVDGYTISSPCEPDDYDGIAIFQTERSMALLFDSGEYKGYSPYADMAAFLVM